MRRTLPCLVLSLALPAGRLGAATVALTPSADTTIFEENGDSADAKGPGLYTGRTTLTFIRRAFVRFDVAGAIPAGSTIVSARLDMVVTNAKGNPVDVSLLRVTGAWGEGTSDAGLPGGGGTQATPGDATWTKRVWPSTDWTAAGGDTAASVSATSPIATPLGTYSFGPTAAMAANVQGWLDSPATNFGWQLRADELQAAPSARRWGSRESANTAERPVLTILFNPPGGGGPPPASADDVPALSGGALLGLAAALAAFGALALRKG
jgi:hypothetical protein